MVSGKSYLDTSKSAAILRNNICDYLLNKRNYVMIYNDIYVVIFDYKMYHIGS